jgi:hypothetical protein
MKVGNSLANHIEYGIFNLIQQVKSSRYVMSKSLQTKKNKR